MSIQLFARGTKFVEKYTNLTKLLFCLNGGFDQTLISVFKNCPVIQFLKLHVFNFGIKFRDYFIPINTNVCKELNYIELKFSILPGGHIGYLFLFSLSVVCTKLETLKLIKCPYVTGFGIATVLKKQVS